MDPYTLDALETLHGDIRDTRDTTQGPEGLHAPPPPPTVHVAKPRPSELPIMHAWVYTYIRNYAFLKQFVTQGSLL